MNHTHTAASTGNPQESQNNSHIGIQLACQVHTLDRCAPSIYLIVDLHGALAARNSTMNQHTSAHTGNIINPMLCVRVSVCKHVCTLCVYMMRFTREVYWALAGTECVFVYFSFSFTRTVNSTNHTRTKRTYNMLYMMSFMYFSRDRTLCDGNENRTPLPAGIYETAMHFMWMDAGGIYFVRILNTHTHAISHTNSHAPQADAGCAFFEAFGDPHI